VPYCRTTNVQTEKRPAETARLIERGQRQALLGRRRRAIELAERIASCELENAAHAVAVGKLFVDCDEPSRALGLFEAAVAADPLRLEYRFYLAVTQRMTGDCARAEDNLDAVLRGRPDFYGAYYIRADLRTQSPERNHIPEMQYLLRRASLDLRGETLLCFALAKELEDVGRFDESFRYLQRGCRAHRGSLDYDVGRDVAAIDSLIRVHTPATVRDRRQRACGSNEPIFIIGLPRSGTTLVERILASHPEVHAGGELPVFPLLLASELQRTLGGAKSCDALAAELLRIDPRALGGAYLEATSPQTRRRARFTDKLPLNYLYAGIIHRALPRARLIAVLRSPLDTCYALYRTLFTSSYLFSYDLVELGRYYIAWRGLMRHWREALGDSLLAVHYERLIADQKGVTRDILAHCGLTWDDRCLAFHEQCSAVTSASAAQVRRPLYASSVGKWKNYTPHLTPLIETLQEHGLQEDGASPDALACSFREA
jgi:tetratricopeptide (TPR) repeat protein